MLACWKIFGPTTPILHTWPAWYTNNVVFNDHDDVINTHNIVAKVMNLLSSYEGFFLIQQVREACLLCLFMLTMKQLQISLSRVARVYVCL